MPDKAFYAAHPVPDATLARLIRPTNPSRRPDKAFTLHPAPGSLRRRWRILSGLQTEP
ncbi:hypothetical protein ACLB1R_04140 [Escherichia coli]